MHNLCNINLKHLVVDLFKRASLKVLVDCWADYVSADDANQGNKVRFKIFEIGQKKLLEIENFTNQF